MNGQFDSVIDVLSTIGAYFAIIMVLSVTVETTIDTLKQNVLMRKLVGSTRVLNFLDIGRHYISPDEAMRDIAYWIPSNSQAELQIAALNNMARQFQVTTNDLTAGADAAFSMANEFVSVTGLPRQTAYARQQLAQKLYVIRRKYNAMEAKRIVRLRRIAAFLGVCMAFLFQLDTFAFLAPLFAPSVQGWLATSYMTYAGMLLTGIASSAGSAFWHDQLDRMRALKESARSLQTQIAKSG